MILYINVKMKNLFNELKKQFNIDNILKIKI